MRMLILTLFLFAGSAYAASTANSVILATFATGSRETKLEALKQDCLKLGGQLGQIDDGQYRAYTRITFGENLSLARCRLAPVQPNPIEESAD